MKLIRPSYEIITPIKGEEILTQIEIAARTCYKSENKIDTKRNRYWVTDNDGNRLLTINDTIDAVSAKILIPKLISRGHEAMLEFGGNIAIKFICDRGISHELVRHRVASFAQESTRYCNYGNDKHITFIIPEWCKNIPIGTFDTSWKQGELIKPFYDANGNINPIFNNTDLNELIWIESIAACEDDYQALIVNNWSPQQARSVLPNSLKTEINVSANIREWRHIFKLRTANAAHPQMRELMRPLLDEFKSKIPILFDDIDY